MRREHKFLIPASKAAALRAMILPHVEVDPYAGPRPGNEYTVRSLYLDTANLGFYHEKKAGLRERIKIRIRGYNEISPGTPVFLEIKRKTGKAVIKRRSSLRYQDVFPFLETGEVEKYILASDGREKVRENARQFLFHFHSRGLMPAASIAYEREAYFSRHEPGLRITFDKNIRSHDATGLVSLDRQMIDLPAMPDHIIFEIKTDFGFPLWLRGVINGLNVTCGTLSKYTICIDSLLSDGQRLHLTHPWTARDRHTLLDT